MKALFEKALLFRPQAELVLEYLDYCESLVENIEMVSCHDLFTHLVLSC